MCQRIKVLSGEIERCKRFHARRWAWVGGIFGDRLGSLNLTECEKRKKGPDRLHDTAWKVRQEGMGAGLYRMWEVGAFVMNADGTRVPKSHVVNLAGGECDCPWHKHHGEDPEAIRCRHLLTLSAVAAAGGFDGPDDDDDDNGTTVIPPDEYAAAFGPATEVRGHWHSDDDRLAVLPTDREDVGLTIPSLAK